MRTKETKKTPNAVLVRQLAAIACALGPLALRPHLSEGLPLICYIDKITLFVNTFNGQL